MSTLAIVVVAATVWIAALLVVLSLCQAAARGDRQL